MTNDDFTEAARAEAEAVMSEARERVGITVQEQTRYVEGHVAGAEWARTHLFEEPTDAEVLAALNADYALRFGPSNLPADNLEPYGDEAVRIMRAALVAAKEARR